MLFLFKYIQLIWNHIIPISITNLIFIQLYETLTKKIIIYSDHRNSELSQKHIRTDAQPKPLYVIQKQIDKLMKL